VYKPNLGKSVEDAADWGGVKEADRGQTQGGHGGMVNAPAGLPSCQQVDDGSDGDQHYIPKAKADVASKVLASGITHTQACRCRDCCDQQLCRQTGLQLICTRGGTSGLVSCVPDKSCNCLHCLKHGPRRTSDWVQLWLKSQVRLQNLLIVMHTFTAGQETIQPEK